jgi:acetylglutamate kinase
MLRDATVKAEVLIEALPFLKRFHGQHILVKVGGEPIEDDSVLTSLLTDLVWLEQVGLRPILVHGGGKTISRAMEQAGLKPVFHASGRRITDAAAMAIVEREVGLLNQHLVNRLIDLGGVAIGLVPPRHKVVRGEILDPDLGLVGRPTAVDEVRILRYASRGIIPVIPPLSVAADGAVMNTNADDIALAIATAMRVEKLMFLSNVPGVMSDPKDPSTLFSSLTPAEVRRLVGAGIIQGGMIPKVESCLAALEQGVGKIHILGASVAHALLLEIFTRDGVGTEISPT